MSLFPTRPRLRLRAPRRVTPGARFELLVLVDAEEALPSDFCDVRIRGREWSASSDRWVMPTLAARIAGARTFPKGTTELACRVAIPSDVPRSTAKGAHGTRVEYEVEVHLSIPWWPDARARFELTVSAASGARPVGRPRVAVSRIEGPAAGVPYAELSVGSDVVEVGGVLDGSLAVRDVGSARTRVVLVAHEGPNDLESSRVGAWHIPIERSASGKPVRFALRIPDEATPTMRGRGFVLGYTLTAEASTALGTLVTTSMPIRVIDRGEAAESARVQAPVVGDGRIEELFVDVGLAHGATVEPGPALVVRARTAIGRIVREVSPDGTRLVVSASHPPLHLALDVHESALPLLHPDARRLARSLGLGPRCLVTCRDEAQARALFARLAPALAQATDVHLDDESLRYVLAVPANDRARIGAAIEALRGALDALETPPFPSALERVADAWRTFAREWPAELEPGHAAMRASLGDDALEIQTILDEDGAPRGTRYALRPVRELPIESWPELERPEQLASLAISADARAALTQLLREGAVTLSSRELRIESRATLGLDVGLAHARDVARALARTAAQLRPASGPFR